MASGREFSSSQRKIINRYYDNIDNIVITRLGEIATDMALAMGDTKKLDRLWKRTEQALAKVQSKDGIKDPAIEKMLASRDLEALGKLITKLNR
ncbi:MAG: hypothetical protein JKX70_01615 [Phycisphaerales bacterium]|nr:hypothetical protein [Phycisphaerales bacterium]